MKSFASVLLLVSTVALADGNLTSDQRISSEVLGYDLQFRVYEPEGMESTQNLRVLFITDGPGYLRQGRMPRVLNRLIESGKIDPVIAVFVDPRDPDNSRKNRRNQQFLCNRDYLRFYVEELIPAVEASWPVAKDRKARGIMGLSFGATNAACFGLFGSDTFSLIGMHSPANHPVDGLLPAYDQMPLLPLRMFLSTGAPNDNTKANRRFHEILEEKGYPLEYVEVRQGHDWSNWRPLIDDLLIYFYGSPE